MGIKSTTTLSRTTALAMLADLRGEPEMTNKEIGDQLDVLMDAKAEREGTVCFDNYLVVDDDSYPERR